jgi:hypothetical protein
LLYLQIIMEMQEQMTGAGPLDIFKKPDHILLFVKHVLVSTTCTPSPAAPPQEEKATKGVGMTDLRFTSTEDTLSDSDSDTEGRNVNTTPDVEMLETALNLLLAILEGLFLRLVPPPFILMPPKQPIPHFPRIHFPFSTTSRHYFCTSLLKSQARSRYWRRKRD